MLRDYFFIFDETMVSKRWIRLIFFSRGFVQQLQLSLSGIVVSLRVGISRRM